MTTISSDEASPKGRLWCRFESFDTLFFEGEVIQVHLPALDGDLTLLPSHASLLTFLRSGFLRLVLSVDHDVQAFFISSGVAEVKKGRLRILAREAAPFREEAFSPFPPESIIFGEETDI